MQTNIHPNLKSLPEVQEAEQILRSCVHCGFCTAVCPTYQELGDDLDSPRGRIYLIKNLLEQDEAGDNSHEHLDRCLTCRSCETTCPSGVQYARLLDIGRGLFETRYQPKRQLLRNLMSAALRFLLPKPRLFAALYRMGLFVKPVLPDFLRSKMPTNYYVNQIESQQRECQSQVLVLQGCVQRSLTPGVNQALESLLLEQGVGVTYLSEEGCCGAVDYHLGHHDAGLERMKALINRIEAQIDQVEWVISTATGCGVTLKDYPELFKHDEVYGPKANHIAAKLRDVSEVVGTNYRCQPVNVAVHTPCTLQHGQKLPGKIEQILSTAGANVVPSDEAHLCCGSSGTYSVLEPALSKQLGTRKVNALTQHAPEVIVTANVGCQTHLDSLADTPVMHWVEFLALYKKP